MADAIDDRRHAPGMVGPETNRPPPLKPARKNLASERHAAALEDKARPRLQLLARVHQGVPLLRARLRIVHGPGTAHQQALHLSAAWIAVPEQPRRKHLGVVEHEQIAGAEISDQVGEHYVVEGAAGTADDEQPGAPAFGGLLRDERLG